MSNYPNQIDSDVELPPVNNNISEIGAEAINALREAVFNIETEIGLSGSGSVGSIATRLGISLEANGTIKPSAIIGLGLVTLPITNDQISDIAAIPESKLNLDHDTQDLYNYILSLSSGVNASNGWISSNGVKLEPHLAGSIYRHTLSQVDVSTSPAQYLKNKFETLRDNTNTYTLINDINAELLEHQFLDGSAIDNIQNIITYNGSVYPSNYAHTASGIFLDTDRFSTIPQTAQDLQTFAQFIDSSSIFLYGTRIQNLYTNGVSRSSRSSSLSTDGYGAPIVPVTPAIAYLLNTGSNSAPFDDINSGDDIIELKPLEADLTNNSFDEKFALVRVGDIIRINYGSIEVGFVIKEKKYMQDGMNKKFIVRIAGKNLFYSTEAVARIDRPLFNNNKFGVLAIAAANNAFDEIPSLIIGSPTGAMALGNGFNAAQFDAEHYLLYLVLYPTGNPNDGYVIMPGLDITGNAGATPGQYTLDSIVEAVNNSIRSAGYNYRFIAYNYQGNFGIMLADSYGNAGFSIVSAVVDNGGNYDETETEINFPNNVIDIFSSVDTNIIDPLGFGITGANIASPLYQTSYGSPEAAVIATKLFVPLKRNNYYVNGGERDKLSLDSNQILDSYGDGYWFATVVNKSLVPGPPGNLEMTYRVMLDLSATGLKIGKTLVVQPFSSSPIIDYGRFIIKNINFGCEPNVYTDITVFDAVHGTGFSPPAEDTDTLALGSEVGIYFNYDSVSFNAENATDFTNVSPFKRHFEVYIDLEGKTFTHERARINASSSNLIINGAVTLYGSSEASKLEIIKVSPKLRGYQFGSVNKITLVVDDYNSTTGIYLGYLSHYDGVSATKRGPYTYGKFGEITRFYDETHVDYVDLLFRLNTTVFNFSAQLLDIQLFPTLSLDEEIMLLATCQLNDVNNTVSHIRDQRQFGNTSEKDLSISALNYISLPERMLHSNGVIRGFQLDTSVTNPNNSQIYLSGGLALVNGKFLEISAQTVNIPFIKEISGILYNVNWAVCINELGEIQTIPLLDYDANLPTPTNTSRLFNAFNLASGATYIIDATTFVNLVTNRKDLTVLYIATALTTADPPTASLSVMDARKFVYNESENISLTWVPGDSGVKDVSGHFQTIQSVISWINKFGTRNNIIKIKGEFNITEVFDLSDILNPVIFLGDGAVFNITDTTGFYVKNNITFDNIIFNYNPIGFPITGNINSDRGCIFGDTLSLGNTFNINIINCTFNTNVAQHPPYISFRIASNTYVDSINITNNKFNDSNSDHDAAIAFVGTETNYLVEQASLMSNINISNNYCNNNQAFYFTGSYSQTGNMLGVPGLTAVNVKIHDNKVGYIGYGISGNNLFNTDIIGEQLFSIERNELIAVVGPLDETGQDVSVNHPDGATGGGLPSGNVVISDNDLNFITGYARCGQPEVDGHVGKLIIDKNRLTAQNYTTKVFDIFGMDPIAISGFTNNNIAIIIDSNAYEGNDESHACAIITNNIINANKIDGTDYNYGGGISTASSSIITNNIIRGLINVESSGNDLGFGITLTKFPTTRHPFSKVHHNSIYRTDQGIRGYVCAFSHAADITDNFFDTSYIDAANTDENVVLLLGTAITGSTVDKNRNQIFTQIINGMEGHVDINKYDIGSVNGSGLIPALEDIAIRRYYYRDPYETIFNSNENSLAIDIDSNISGPTISWTLPLKNYLPQGVVVLNASIKAGSTSNPASGGSITLIFEKKKTHASSEETVVDSFVIDSGYTPNDPIELLADTSSNNWKINVNEIYNVLRVRFNSGSYAGVIYYDSIILKYKW